MAHTPGPWFWAYDNTLAGGDPDGDWTLIAAIHNAGPVSDANASLIAAAPDLLAIAKDIYPLFLDGVLYADHDRGTELLGQLRRAIAKAEGRQP